MASCFSKAKYVQGFGIFWIKNPGTFTRESKHELLTYYLLLITHYSFSKP
ncbi:MAG: hypothetical protein F6K47_27115 [Symploca sp. SIO2E6]|nr:hypothetical protein [Symploca sp. SIO2E6]